MESNGRTGPDMMKILHTLLPYMDPSTRRMMSIMVKLQELKELMEPEQQPQEEKPEAEQQGEEERTSDPGGVKKQPALTDQLREGLTPEQQNMMTSLTDMLG